MRKQVLLFSLWAAMMSMLLPMTAQAQQTGNEYAMFSWQNNGDFNAFLNSDVDSITFSKTDLDGRKHDRIVVQEVWKQDTVYRIPVAAIDSVTFRAPDPVLKKGVFHITNYHFPFVTDVTDATVTFSASILADSLPSVGQVVITDVYEGLLERGFAGRVTNIVTNGDNVIIECEAVTIGDVYDQLVSVGKSVSYIDDGSPAGAPKTISYEKEGVLTYELARWNTKIIDYENDGKSGNLEITVVPSISLDYAICYNVKGKENHFKCVVSPTLDCDFDTNWKISGSKSLPENPIDFVNVKIPTKVPGLIAKVGVSSFVDFEGSAELNVKVPLRIQANAGYDSWRMNEDKNPFFVNFDGTGIRSIDGASQGKFQLKLDGSAHVGLTLNFTVFFLHEDLANAQIGLSAGPRFSATIDYSNDLVNKPSWYDFNETKLSVEPLVASLSASVKPPLSEGLSWNSPKASIFGKKDYYLFPAFTAPKLNELNSNLSLTALTTNVSRNLISSVTPGLGLYQGDKLKHAYFSNQQYKREKEWNPENLQMELKDAGYAAGDYTAKPIFKFLNDTVEAYPTSTITVAKALSVQETANVKNGETLTISFSGGWGDYSLSNSATGVCKASMTGNKIKVTGLENGTALLTLADKRSKESKRINVFVSETAQPPTIKVTPGEHDFGTVVLGESGSKTFTVACANVTDGVSISKSGNTGMFSVVNSTDATGNGTFAVAYNPIAVGKHEMTIYVTCAYGPRDTIKVKGECVKPTVKVSPATLNFGTVLLGDSISKTFTVTDTDIIGNLTLRSTNSTRYKFSGNKTSITLAPNANRAINKEVTVIYKPTQAQSNGGYIVITGTNINDTVYLSGKCVVPTLTVNPESLAFESVVGDTSKPKTITVTCTNMTATPTVTLNQDIQGIFKITSNTVTKDGGTIKLTFTPESARSYSGKLTITGGNVTKTVSLTGTGVQPAITVTPKTLSFGTVPFNSNVSSAPTKTFTVKGTNLTGDVSVSSNSTLFTVSAATITAAEAMAGKTVTVTFLTYKPGAVGSEKTATITVSSKDVDDRTVGVSGTCVQPTISTNKTDLNFDSQNTTDTVRVYGHNLTGSLSLSAGIGYTVSPTTISASDANSPSGVEVKVGVFRKIVN